MKLLNGCEVLNSIKKKKTLVFVYEAYVDSDGVIQDWYYPFMGRVSDVSIDINGNYDVECEGAFAFLNDIVMAYHPDLHNAYHSREIDDYVEFYKNAKYIFKSAVEATELFGHYADRYPFKQMVMEFDESASDWMSDGYEYEILKDGFDFPEINKEELEYSKVADVITNKIINEYSGVLYFLYYLPTDPTHMNDNPPDPTGINPVVYELILENWKRTHPDHPIRLSYTHDINPGFGYNHDGLEFPTVEAIWVEDYGWYPSFGIGDNIISISKEALKTEIYTGIMPIGKDGLKLNNTKNHFDVSDTESIQYNYFPVRDDDVIWIPELVQKYGYIIKAVEFSDIETVTELRQAGNDYINRFARDFGFKYTINAIEPCEVFDDMNKLVKLAHITMVKDTDNVVHVIPCLSIKLDLFDLQNNEYVIGPIVPDSVINEDISNM